ncbi:hypothetical protein [Paenibacillus sp. CCS19]|uniref:hypothetical protein n=1 Tax=Paenibacillus sp. CCS19 TaxID=3158387 RepID=UPI00295E963F|nr:hypothetical protein [Paenibacillus cellulosilyticus]
MSYRFGIGFEWLYNQMMQHIDVPSMGGDRRAGSNKVSRRANVTRYSNPEALPLGGKSGRTVHPTKTPSL